MSRRYERSEIDIDRYDDRRTSHAPRESRDSRRYDDRSTFEEDLTFRRGSGPVPGREREVLVKEREKRDVRGPDFLREDYGRSPAGPLVLKARETEDFEFAARPRRRSPSPEPPRQERSEIIIRHDERSESRAPPPRRREESREREEIIIRREERSPSRAPPSTVRERTRGVSRDRAEILIRRDEREREPYRPPPRAPSREREEIIIRRSEDDTRSRYDDDVVSRRSYRPPPPREEVDRQEIIIRRREEEVRPAKPPPRRYEDDFDLVRPKSHERARSRRRSESRSDDEIIIRREGREGGRRGDVERQEIIIRRSSISRSPSPAPSLRSVRTSRTARTAAPEPAPPPPPEPQVVYAPQIHQEVVTHHRHVDHGYELAIAPRPPPPREISRPPSPPSPPPPPVRERARERPRPREPSRSRSRSEERIQITRTETRDGRRTEEEIVIDRNDSSSRTSLREPRYEPPARAEPPRRRPDWEERAMAEEAEYYNERAMQRGHPGEAWHGATRDWGLVDVPPGTRRVRMDGAGGGAQEITWQRYNGSRRSKFMPDSVDDEGYGSEVARPAPRALEPPAPIPIPEPEPEPASAGTVGPRYGRQKDPRDGLWTEVTKDLVVKEAIQEMGYEYQETEKFYYIFEYLRYEDMAHLVGLSEDIKKERSKRISQIRWENNVEPEPPRDRLAIEAPPSSVGGRDRDRYSRDEERYIEREVIYRGGRPPPPVGWRR